MYIKDHTQALEVIQKYTKLFLEVVKSIVIVLETIIKGVSYRYPGIVSSRIIVDMDALGK